MTNTANTATVQRVMLVDGPCRPDVQLSQRVEAFQRANQNTQRTIPLPARQPLRQRDVLMHGLWQLPTPSVRNLLEEVVEEILAASSVRVTSESKVQSLIARIRALPGVIDVQKVKNDEAEISYQVTVEADNIESRYAVYDVEGEFLRDSPDLRIRINIFEEVMTGAGE